MQIKAGKGFAGDFAYSQATYAVVGLLVCTAESVVAFCLPAVYGIGSYWVQLYCVLSTGVLVEGIDGSDTQHLEVIDLTGGMQVETAGNLTYTCLHQWYVSEGLYN